MKLGVLLAVGVGGLSVVAAPLVQTVAAFEVPHARVVAFSPDGALLAVAAGSEILLFTSGPWAQVGGLQGHEGTVADLGFLPRTGHLASASWDGTVRLWDPRRGAVVKTLSVSGGASDILAVAVSHDEKTVVVGCVEEKSRLGLAMWYDLGSGRLLRSKILSVGMEIPAMGGTSTFINRVRDVAFSPDGSLLAAGSEDKTVRIWDRTGEEVVATLKDHPGAVYALAFSPNGRRLAAASWREIGIWEVGTGNRLATLSGHRNQVWTVAWSPDGALLASGAYDGYVRLWDAESFALLLSERLLTPVSGFGAPVEQGVLALAFSPDGRFLAAVGSGGRVAVWEVSRE